LSWVILLIIILLLFSDLAPLIWSQDGYLARKNQRFTSLMKKTEMAFFNEKKSVFVSAAEIHSEIPSR